MLRRLNCGGIWQTVLVVKHLTVLCRAKRFVKTGRAVTPNSQQPFCGLLCLRLPLRIFTVRSHFLPAYRHSVHTRDPGPRAHLTCAAHFLSYCPVTLAEQSASFQLWNGVPSISRLSTRYFNRSVAADDV